MPVLMVRTCVDAGANLEVSSIVFGSRNLYSLFAVLHKQFLLMSNKSRKEKCLNTAAGLHNTIAMFS